VSESFAEKTQEVKELFRDCHTVEAKYQRIIELGRQQVPLAADVKNDKTLVRGCQSVLYLQTTLSDGKLYFQTEAEALISAGLGQLLTRVYSGESPETILRNPPKYIEEMEIAQTLTPGRANGLASMYVRMKEEALQCLMRS